MNVAERLVERLVTEGIEVLFTVPGEQHDQIFQALTQTDIRVIQTRHEQAAAFMAYGYARSTGRIGAFMVISGPGVLYATPGLATAFAGSNRVLCLASQVSTEFLGKGLGVPHEMSDQLKILATLSGWAGRITEPAAVDVVLSEAFHRLARDRPRPVSIEIPVDVMGKELRSVAPWQAPQSISFDAAAVTAMCAELLGARNPMIYVGSGARDAAPRIREFAERLSIPVTTEIGGRGILPADHPLSVPFPVAHRVWAQVDVVLAIGTRFRRPQAEWGIDGLKVLRIDLDEAEMTRSGPPSVAVVGDADEVMRSLLGLAEPVNDYTEWKATVAANRDEVEAELAQITPQSGFLDAIRAALPSNGIMVDELTQVGYFAWAAFPVYEPYTYLSSTYLGALGFGFSTALGAKVANPDRPVLSISGDGGFLYTAVELATSIQHGIGIVAVVFDDGSYANVDRSQRNHMNRAIATDLRNPDFVAFAESFGAVGVYAHDADELRTEIEKAFERADTTTVIVVPVGEMSSPWPFVRLPRVR